MTQRNVREERRWAVIDKYSRRVLDIDGGPTKRTRQEYASDNYYLVEIGGGCEIVRVTILVPTKEKK